MQDVHDCDDIIGTCSSSVAEYIYFTTFNSAYQYSSFLSLLRLPLCHDVFSGFIFKANLSRIVCLYEFDQEQKKGLSYDIEFERNRKAKNRMKLKCKACAVIG